ncbi:MAG: VWA domain-containing protein [Acidobacteriota bacterium]
MRKGQAFLGMIMSLVLLCSALTTLAQSSGPTHPQGEQSSEETIHIDATLVNVPLIVVDKQGKYIANLRAEDFLIYEDGAQQEIAFFSAETVPFYVVLLLDVSNSARTHLTSIQRAARSFVAAIREKERVMMISFATDITVLSRFTSDKEELEEAIQSLELGGGTRLYDAVLKAARDKLKRIKGRKALIVLTDGDDRGSYMHASYVIDEVLESGALVYVVRYPVRNTSSALPPLHGGQALLQKGKAQYPYSYNYDFIQDLINRTGGTLLSASSVANLVGPMKNIADELRHIYSIGYYPTNAAPTSERRKIEVKLRNFPQAVLRYKKSYDSAKTDKSQPSVGNKLLTH